MTAPSVDELLDGLLLRRGGDTDEEERHGWAMGYQDLEGWMTYEDVYDEAVLRAPHGSQLVEVGVAHGRSLAYLAGKAIEADKDLLVWGVDIWLGDDYEEFRAGFRKHAPRECNSVLLYRGRSVDAAATFADESLAFVFIDADHAYESVKADIAAWWPKVMAGGVLAGHDFSRVDWPGVVQAVEEAFGLVEPVGKDRYCWQCVR